MSLDPQFTTLISRAANAANSKQDDTAAVLSPPSLSDCAAAAAIEPGKSAERIAHNLDPLARTDKGSSASPGSLQQISDAIVSAKAAAPVQESAHLREAAHGTGSECHVSTCQPAAGDTTLVKAADVTPAKPADVTPAKPAGAAELDPVHPPAVSTSPQQTTDAVNLASGMPKQTSPQAGAGGKSAFAVAAHSHHQIGNATAAAHGLHSLNENDGAQDDDVVIVHTPRQTLVTEALLTATAAELDCPDAAAGASPETHNMDEQTGQSAALTETTLPEEPDAHNTSSPGTADAAPICDQPEQSDPGAKMQRTPVSTAENPPPTTDHRPADTNFASKQGTPEPSHISLGDTASHPQQDSSPKANSSPEVDSRPQQSSPAPAQVQDAMPIDSGLDNDVTLADDQLRSEASGDPWRHLPLVSCKHDADGRGCWLVDTGKQLSCISEVSVSYIQCNQGLPLGFRL